MFTGLVEERGVVESITIAKAIQLVIRAKTCGRDLKISDSLAVNGCCLTVVKIISRGQEKLIQLDLLQETWQRTNLQFLKKDSAVNLERALRADARFGGHFVTGHIDGIGKILRWEKSGADYVLEIAAPPEVMRYLIFKGSFAVDGISLTVAALAKKSFRVWIIPHTFAVTALRERKVGDALNVEVDLLGKYAERFVTSWKKGSKGA
ncbi:MAG: riboflavin synthase [Verrucomicrobiota bacterium]|nr:riboflavin synthase [Verrucomicrobiota bacterium]